MWCAPYATLLAVNIAPRESVRNLKRLAKLGLLTINGVYEALDMSQPIKPRGRARGDCAGTIWRITRMSFLSLAISLMKIHSNVSFRSDSRVRAVEPCAS